MQILKPIACLLLCGVWVAQASAQSAQMSAPEALHASRAGQVLLIDVRSKQEWQATGLPAGALAISIHQPGGAKGFHDAVLAASNGNRQQPIALICASGVRSGLAMRLLAKDGFSKLFNVSEGMEGSRDGPGWRRRGLPTVPFTP